MSPFWPVPGNELPPEGHYSFKLNREPDFKKDTDKNGKEYVRLVLYVTALGADGNYRVADGFVPWDPRYTDLCKALGVEHGKDIFMDGAVFEGEIKHEEFKGKIHARIANIVVQIDIPDKDDGIDIPF